MNIAIIGPTISGNKGAAGMFESSVQTISEIYPDTEFSLLSYYPKADLLQKTFSNVRVMKASPKYLALVIVPTSFIYGIFKFFNLPTFPFRKIKEVAALEDADVILDEGGISFVDGRERYLIFNIAILLPGLFMKKRIVKCAQAMGPFKNPMNRILAKIFLPRMDLIVARGKKTLEHLHGINVKKNVVLGSDYAFSLRISNKDEEGIKRYLNNRVFKSKQLVGICPSEVIQDYCEKNNKNYVKITSDFINYLTEVKKYNVAIIPHSIRPNTEKKKNNDLPICELIFEMSKNKERVLLVDDDLNPRELRVLIGKCKLFVGSRFHSMISSLSMKVPTLVVGWSHKYKEVLDMFGVEEYSISQEELSLERMLEYFEKLERNQDKLLYKIEKSLPNVISMSDAHVKYIKKIATERSGKFKLGILNDATQEYYLGKFKDCQVGYSASKEVRRGAASGGIISTTLIHLLETGKIDGALVTMTKMKNGELDYETFIATTPSEILSARTSVYFDVPILTKLDEVRKFDGKVAVVGLPCQISLLKKLISTDSELKNKVVFTIGMFCGHASKKSLIQDVLKRKGIIESDIEEFKFRKGFWRGKTFIRMKNGQIIQFPFSEYSTYQNLFFDSADRCMACNDHTSENADISCGDVWDQAYKKIGIKHNALIVRSKLAKEVMDEMCIEQKVCLKTVHPEKIFRAQSRSLIYHKHIKARANLYRIFTNTKIKCANNVERARFNDYLAAWMILMNVQLAKSRLGRFFIFKLPRKFWHLYLIMFKGLTSF